MIEINIQTKDYAWIAKLSVKIKEKTHEKELKGIFENKEEIIETIFSTLKSKKDLVILTNDEELQILLEGQNESSELIETSFDFSEIMEHKEREDPTIPENLNKGFQEVCIYDTKEQNQIAVSAYFVKAYMFFNENPEKIKEITLLKDLKEKGIYSKEVLIEDIMQTIEETLLI